MVGSLQGTGHHLLIEQSYKQPIRQTCGNHVNANSAAVLFRCLRFTLVCVTTKPGCWKRAGEVARRWQEHNNIAPGLEGIVCVSVHVYVTILEINV